MPKGKKYGGRKKGSLNKKTVEFRQALDGAGFYAPSELIALIRKPFKVESNGMISGLSDAMKAKVILEMLSYIYPKKSPIIENPGDVELQKNITYRVQWGDEVNGSSDSTQKKDSGSEKN